MPLHDTKIELWGSGMAGVPCPDGNTFVELVSAHKLLYDLQLILLICRNTRIGTEVATLMVSTKW